MSLEQLLYQNRCIKSKACMEIYKNSCLKIQECFEGLISHPAMIILTIFFNVDTWPLDIQKKLCEAKKIKSIGNLFVSALSKNWENCDLEKAKLTINDITTRFALMNEIFPCPTLEMRLELNKIMYIDTRKMINDWMNGQCQQIDSVYSQIRPANIDLFIAECKECRSTGSNFLLLESFKGIGKMFREIKPNSEASSRFVFEIKQWRRKCNYNVNYVEYFESIFPFHNGRTDQSTMW